MSFFVLDASVWVARLVPQDEFHETVKAWMAEQRIAEVQFVSPSLLLAEVAGAVSRRTGNVALARKAVRELEMLPGLRLVEMNNVLLLEAATLAADLGLRGADSVYVATAKRLGVPLITFDVDQRERGKKQVSIHDI
jgi:predicted nucleic acid-binding protein